MLLRTANLNLVPVLNALLKEGSVSGAAKRLGLSQPATSAALAKLRHILDDPLLVPVGRRMRLSSRALELAPSVDLLCIDLERLIGGASFHPAKASRTFTIAAPDYLAFLLGEKLVPLIQAAAPGVRVRFVDVPGALLPARLATHELDCAVCADFKVWPTLFRSEGFSDHIVALARDTHAIFEISAPQEDDILQHPQFTFFRGLDATERKTSGLQGDDAREDGLYSAQQFLVLSFLSAQTNGMAWVPKSLAERLISILPLKMVKVEHGETELDTCIFWGPAQAADPAQQWLRSVINDALRASLVTPPRRA